MAQQRLRLSLHTPHTPRLQLRQPGAGSYARTQQGGYEEDESIAYSGTVIRSDVIVLGEDGETGEVITLGDEEATLHTHVLGVTGVGKSTLLINAFLGSVNRGQGGAYITPDIGAIQSLIARIPPHRLADVVYLNPGDRAYPFGFNLLYCEDVLDQEKRERAADRLMHLFKRLWGPGTEDAAWGTRLENILRNSIYTLMYHGLTLADIPSLLQDAQFREQKVQALPRIGPWYHVRNFWKNYDKLSFRVQEERTESTLNRVLAFVIKSTIENIVGQQQTTIDFTRIMQEQKILLVRLAEDDIQDEGIKLLGTMIVAELLQAALGRERIPEEEWYYFSLVCDEFPEFASDDFHKLLTRARKYKVKIMIASQYLDRKDERIRRAVENTGNKVTFRTTLEDAPYYAPIYAKDPPPGEMIYEKQMRRAGKSYEIEYWEPPEAEEECKQAIFDLRKIIRTQKRLLYLDAFSEQSIPLPISLPPVTRNQENFEDVGTFTVEIGNPKNWDVLAHVYSQPLTASSSLWNYLVQAYKTNGERNTYGNLIQYDFSNLDLVTYLLDTYYQPEQYDEPGSWHEKMWTGKEKIVHGFRKEWRLGIRPHVRPHAPYRFTIAYLTNIEQLFAPNRKVVESGGMEKYEIEAAQALLREVTSVLSPFTQQAVFYFNPEEYREREEDFGQFLIDNDGKRYPYEISDPFNTYGYQLRKEWQGPFYPDEEKVWIALLKWAQQKIVAVDRQKQEAVQTVRRLGACYHRETKVSYLGWYEPVPVMEWEYLQLSRELGKNPVVGENVRYSARQGPSPYTTMEMRNQMETELLRLPVHTAYCQIQNFQEHNGLQAVVRCNLRTYPLPEAYTRTETAVADREQYVRERTRRLYCRPRRVVEEEIARRREIWNPDEEAGETQREEETSIKETRQVVSPPLVQPLQKPIVPAEPIVVPQQPIVPSPERKQQASAVSQMAMEVENACDVCGAMNSSGAETCKQCGNTLSKKILQEQNNSFQASKPDDPTPSPEPPRPPKRKSRRG